MSDDDGVRPQPLLPDSLNFRFATDRVHVRLTKKKLVFGRRDRPELPHLTVMLETASGEVDIHLNYEQRPKDERYEPVVKRPFKELIDAYTNVMAPLAAEFQATVVTAFKPVTPGWLRRRRYLVAYSAPAEFISGLRADTPYNRKRKRYQVPSLAHFLAKDGPLYGGVRVFRPEVLRLLPLVAVERPIQAQAFTMTKRRRPSLKLVFDGDRWLAMPMHYVHERMMVPMARAMRPLMPAISEAFHQVWEAMELWELNIEDPLAVEQRRRRPRSSVLSSP